MSLKGDTAERGGVMSVTLALIAFAAFVGVFGHQILFSVVPLYVDDIGGGSAGAGAANGLYLFSTVLTQTQMPRILPRFGYRVSLMVGVLLLALPVFLYPFAGTLALIVAISLVRGVGFGIVTVVVFALVAEVTPSGRLGEALGVVGVAVAAPTVFCSALGLWLAENVGFLPVFLLGAILPLFGIVSAVGVGSVPAPVRGSDDGFLAGISRGPLLRVVIIFCSMTIAAGAILTFLPISASGSGLFSATVALLFFAVSTTFFRWWGGRLSDRIGPSRLLTPSLILGAAGAASLSAGGFWLLPGALLFGAGFGMLQNVTLLMMMDRVKEGEYGLGSTLWNAAFDAGAGVGAFAFGFVIPYTGFVGAYLICASVLLGALIIVSLDRTRTKEAAKP